MLSTFEFSGNVVGILIKSDMDQSVYDEMKNLLKEKIQEHQKINLFIEVEKGNDISVKTMMKHLKFTVEHAASFNKIAVVTNKGWFRNGVAVKDLLIKADVEAFSHEKRIEAVQWIAQ